MKQFKNILICIDDFDRDESVVRFVEGMVRIAETESVHLVYVPPDLWQPRVVSAPIGEIPPIVSRDFAVDFNMEEQRERFENLRNHCLDEMPDCEVTSHVVAGSPLFEILEYALTRNVDLIAMRRSFGDSSEKGSRALLVRRVTRKATCSVLCIPENAKFEANRILVPHRNSECSQNAFVEACAIAESTRGIIDALNIYQVNSYYMYAGVPLSTHIANLEKYAQHETQMLLDKVVLGNAEIRLSFLPDLDADPARVILRHAEENTSDMIVIGARGRTGAAGVLLGTVTEQLIQKAPMPVLAVKQKGECIGFLKALIEVMGFER